MINNFPPLVKDYNRDLHITALKSRGLVKHGSTSIMVRGTSSRPLKIFSGFYKGYIGMMETKMETTILCRPQNDIRTLASFPTSPRYNLPTPRTTCFPCST